MHPDHRIGISGWTYAPWRGHFYPDSLPQRRELEYVASRMNSLEINGSFYSLQKPDSYAKWRDATPPGFVFAVKGGRFITHMKKLRGVDAALANFFASGPLALGDKLGPILWQLPPQLGFDAQRLSDFFDLLPRTTAEAADLARRHNDKLKHPPFTEVLTRQPIRHALEVRHASFMTPQCIELLREHRVALVLADTAGRWPYTEDLTADFVYIRLHGSTQLYASGYRDDELDWWADRIAAWSAGREPADARHVTDQPPPSAQPRDIYVYFDNDAKVAAPFDALRLTERCG